MKPNVTKPSHARKFFNLLMALGLIAMLFAPTGMAGAQAENPTPWHPN